MKKILITRRLLKESEDKASKMFDAHLNSNDELYSQSRLIELSQGCDAVLTSLTDKMDADTINKLPETIKVISNFAVGFGNIDLEAAKKRGIAVTNTPEVLSDATAEIGILLILGACRRASEGIEAARESNWKWSCRLFNWKTTNRNKTWNFRNGSYRTKNCKYRKIAWNDYTLSQSFETF